MSTPTADTIVISGIPPAHFYAVHIAAIESIRGTSACVSVPEERFETLRLSMLELNILRLALERFAVEHGSYHDVAVAVGIEQRATAAGRRLDRENRQAGV